LYLQECGYSLEEVNEIPAIIWPPAVEISNEFEPVFKSRKLIFVSPKASTPGSVFLHEPFDTDEDALRVPFVKAKGGDGSFALVGSEGQMRFVSSNNSVASAAAILWSDGDSATKILDDPAFLVECEKDGSKVAIRAPFPCRVSKSERRKNAATVFDLKAHEEIHLQIDSGDHIAVLRPLRASSGFAQVLHFDAERRQIRSGATWNDKPRALAALAYCSSGKRIAIMRKEPAASFKRETLKLARIRKGKR
jgi:hypothetical protein